jgi:hypothetical protein
MRITEKNFVSHEGSNQLFGVDFHDFIQKEQHASSLELASEFGISLGDVKKLRKYLSRS